MRGFTVHNHIDFILAGSFDNDLARYAARIKGKAKVCFKPAGVHILRAIDSAFFSNGKDNLYIAMREIVFFNNTQGF